MPLWSWQPVVHLTPRFRKPSMNQDVKCPSSWPSLKPVRWVFLPSAGKLEASRVSRSIFDPLTLVPTFLFSLALLLLLSSSCFSNCSLTRSSPASRLLHLPGSDWFNFILKHRGISRGFGSGELNDALSFGLLGLNFKVSQSDDCIMHFISDRGVLKKRPAWSKVSNVLTRAS